MMKSFSNPESFKYDQRYLLTAIWSERKHKVWSSLEFRFNIQITVSPFPKRNFETIFEPSGWLKARELCMSYVDMLCGFFHLSLCRIPLGFVRQDILLATSEQSHCEVRDSIQRRNRTKCKHCCYRGTRVPSLPLLWRADQAVSSGYHLCPVPAMSSNGPLSLEFGYCAYLV